MRILFDENVDPRLRRHLPEHEVSTVQREGWQGKQNGELIRLMAGRFEALLTLDQALPREQDLVSSNLAVIVLRTAQGSLEHVLPYLDRILEELQRIKPGTTVVIGPCPSS